MSMSLGDPVRTERLLRTSRKATTALCGKLPAFLVQLTTMYITSTAIIAEPLQNTKGQYTSSEIHPFLKGLAQFIALMLSLRLLMVLFSQC
ncbi:hypothetical protein [Shewanella xiamenensis]|uniref:hypothetical protein n=1 Tax=Shewanella xiamenensis TaxID=332186 RepID=UPI000C12C0B7|nr:hypothetical protein [Shewanella xiamenensis]MDH1314832.1 hypothetical protein [Shewanella xiamenensis]PHY62423.1 hypothetical protein CS023_11030 [Shewanella xiamenensis]